MIDLTFTNMKYCTGAGTINYNISDHKPIYILKKKPRNIKKTIHYGRTNRNYTYEKLAEVLITNDKEEIFKEKNPNQCWSKLFDMIVKAADIICPIVEIRIRENTAEYLNKELQELQNDRDYFYQKADITDDPCDRFVSDCLKTKARIEVRKAKASYCQRQIEFHKKEHRKLWRDIKDIDPEAKPEVANIVDDESGEKI